MTPPGQRLEKARDLMRKVRIERREAEEVRNDAIKMKIAGEKAQEQAREVIHRAYELKRETEQLAASQRSEAEHLVQVDLFVCWVCHNWYLNVYIPIDIGMYTYIGIPAISKIPFFRPWGLQVSRKHRSNCW